MIRSVLFSPATRLDRLERGLASRADLVVIDLEDGVGTGEKASTRQAVADSAADLFGGKPRVGLRINALSTPDGIQDMAAMLNWSDWPAVLVLPKVNAPAEVAQLISLLGPKPTRLLITLETAQGIANAVEILAVAPKGALVGYGSADHMAETGGQINEAGLAWARGQVVNAAACAGIPALDGVWLDYKDDAGLFRETALIRDIGFSGKIAIHPDQIATINAAFKPDDTALSRARAMVAASVAAGGGAFSFNGKMVDAPVLARAHRMLEFAERNIA